METLSILRVLFAWQKVRKPRVGDHLLYDNITGLAGACHWVVLGSAVLSFGDQGPTFAQPSRSDFSVYGRWILIVHHCSSCKTPGSLLSKISVEWPVMVSCNSLPVNMVAPRSYDVLLFFFFSSTVRNLSVWLKTAEKSINILLLSGVYAGVLLSS